MNRFVLSLILFCGSVFAVDCSVNPFDASCEAVNANKSATAVLCENGTILKSDGSSITKTGTVTPNDPQVTSLDFSSASSMAVGCKSKGSALSAYVEDGKASDLQTLVVAQENIFPTMSTNTSNYNSVSAASGSGVVGTNQDLSAFDNTVDPHLLDTNFWTIMGGTTTTTTGGGASSGGGGTSCSATCDCPNGMDVCQGGVCVTVDSTFCAANTGFNGLVKGDASCQWQCDCGSGSPLCVCPATGGPCGGGRGGSTCKADGESCMDYNGVCGPTDTCSECCNPPSGTQTCTGPNEVSVGTCGGTWDPGPGMCLECT